MRAERLQIEREMMALRKSIGDGMPAAELRNLQQEIHVFRGRLLVAAIAVQLGFVDAGAVESFGGAVPFVQAWLTVKVLLIIAYIGLGLVALRFAATPRARIVSFAAALLVFAYTISVALAHNPLGIFHDLFA